jgi:hypothetical protein
MSQLFLPAAHTEGDLVLAGQIAERIESAELYVTWTPEHGTVAPEVCALLRDPTPRWTDALALIFQAVRELWAAVLARDLPAAPATGAPGTRTSGAAPASKPAAGEAPA